MKKRVLAFLLAAVFAFSLVMSVSAETVATYDIAGVKRSLISYTGGRAHCVSSITDTDNVIKHVKIDQSLEKFAFLWFWTVEDGPRSYNSGSGNATFQNYKSVSTGTYRVKSVFTVTLKDGRSETVTVYSSELKVA